jgi:hypothetical protein
MFRSLIVASLFALGAPALATPHAADTARAEMLGAWCEDGLQMACRQLVTETGGNCAAPVGSGCRYDSGTLAPVSLAVDNGLMADVPGHGLSRVETIAFCLEETGVARYQDLITDSHFDGFGACLEAQT